MPDNWIVVQVGPVCRVPDAARYGVRRRWWYVYQRSRLGSSAAEREVDPWSVSACPDWLDAQKAMHRQAGKSWMPWRVVRDGCKRDGAVAYYLTREEAKRLKAFDSDRIEPVDWGKENEDETTDEGRV